MRINSINKSMMRNFGSAVMNMALLASPFATGAATNAYYSSRRANYGRNNSYLIDEGLNNLKAGNWKHKLKDKEEKTKLENYWSADDLVLNKSVAVTELIVVDGHIHNKDLFSKLIKPGVELLRIDNDANGFDDLMTKLEAYQGLSAIHLFANSQQGQVLLGNQLVSEATIQNSVESFSQFNGTIKVGGELLIYNTQLENNTSTKDNLEILKAKDIRPTTPKITFNEEELSITKGDINAYPEEGSVARNSLPFTTTTTFSFQGSFDDEGGYDSSADDVLYTKSTFQLKIDGASDYVYAYTYDTPQYVSLGNGNETSVTLSFTGGQSFQPNSISLLNSFSNGADQTDLTFTTNNGGSVTFDDLDGQSASGAINLTALPVATSITITGTTVGKAGKFQLQILELKLDDITTPTGSSSSPTTLNPADLVVLQYNSEGNDEIALLALADLAAGEVVFVSDISWIDATSTFGSGSERALRWVIPAGGLTAGTIIRFDNSTGALMELQNSAHGTLTYVEVDGPTETGSSRELSLSDNGDQLIIFQTSDDVVTSAKTFIYGFNNQINSSSPTTDATGWQVGTHSGSSNSNLPSGLTALDATQSNKTTATAFGASGLIGVETPNWQYTGDESAADRDTWLTRIHTLNNWSRNTGSPFSNDDLGGSGTANYTLSGGGGAGDTDPPTFDVAPAASLVNEDGFTVSATINETGDIYYVVVENGAAAPSVANILAGQANGGGSALASGSTLNGTTLSNTVTGLNAGTNYDVYFVAQDDEGTPNVQSASTKVDVKTSAPSSLKVAAKVFLEGAYNTSTNLMNTTINGEIPTTQPHSFNGFSGGSAGSIPMDAVDWIVVELRESTNGTTIGAAAGFLMKDGSTKAINGTDDLEVTGLTGNSGIAYHVVIYHRNHVPIISKDVIDGSSGTLTIDFTDDKEKALGTDAMELLSSSPDVYGMFAGDANGDGDVTAADLTSWRGENGKAFSYGSSGNDQKDLNLDGVINAVDRNEFQQKNQGETNNVPSN